MGGRPERLDLERDRVGGRGQLGQLRGERGLKPCGVGARLAQGHARAPGAARDEARGQGDRAQRAAAALGAREHARDEQLERALELLAERRLGQLEPLEHRLGRAPWLERRVAAAREVEREQARMPEALGDGGRRQPRQLAEGADAEPLERLRHDARAPAVRAGSETGSGASHARTPPSATTSARRGRARRAAA